MKNRLLKMVVLSFMVALGVVISPILRVEGMCPMAHFINVVCSVLLGPYYSLAAAVMIGIIRIVTMGIPPIALTGAIFGAFLSGIFYRISKGNLLMAVLGEVIGTGIIGAVVSYPVMSLLWGKEGLSWLFYVPSFICGTLIGGSIAFAFLRKLSHSGLLQKFQRKLQSNVYADSTSLIGNSIAIASVGVIIYVVVGIASNIFEIQAPVLTYVSKGILAVFVIFSAVYYISKRVRKEG